MSEFTRESMEGITKDELIDLVLDLRVQLKIMAFNWRSEADIVRAEYEYCEALRRCSGDLKEIVGDLDMGCRYGWIREAVAVSTQGDEDDLWEQ